MNKYKILLKSTDPMGMRFLSNLMRFANKGATLDRQYSPSLKFPHKAMLYFETEEYLYSNEEMEILPIEIIYTKEMLDEMDWEKFKATVGAKGVGGRKRNIMTNNYLKVVNGEKLEESEEE